MEDVLGKVTVWTAAVPAAPQRQPISGTHSDALAQVGEKECLQPVPCGDATLQSGFSGAPPSPHRVAYRFPGGPVGSDTVRDAASSAHLLRPLFSLGLEGMPISV